MSSQAFRPKASLYARASCPHNLAGGYDCRCLARAMHSPNNSIPIQYIGNLYRRPNGRPPEIKRLGHGQVKANRSVELTERLGTVM